MNWLPEHPPQVVEHARAKLLRNAYLALRNIDCEFQDGVLVLRGCVPSYHLKQMAQATVSSLAGVDRVVNEIEVVPHPPVAPAEAAPVLPPPP